MELKPCPFCGAAPEWNEPHSISQDNYWLGCMTAKCVAPYITDTDRDYCATLWNTRFANDAGAAKP